MLLAVDVMDQRQRDVLAAVILFVLSAIGYSRQGVVLAPGLACFAFPFFWDQLAAM